MTYATKQAMLDRFSERELAELTDAVAHSSIDDATLAPALAFAGDLINSKLRARYTVPLATVPQIIIDYACDIARYRLYGDAVPELIKERFAQAMNYLNDLALGRATLSIEAPARGLPEIVSPERVFGRDQNF